MISRSSGGVAGGHWSSGGCDVVLAIDASGALAAQAGAGVLMFVPASAAASAAATGSGGVGGVAGIMGFCFRASCRAPDSAQGLKKIKALFHHTGPAERLECVDCANYITPWHTEWQQLGRAQSPTFPERRIDGRPRDLGDDAKKTMIELQHSAMGSAEFDDRNRPMVHSTWIFDATAEQLLQYTLYPNLRLCEDTFRATYQQSAKVHVLFHCADGNL